MKKYALMASILTLAVFVLVGASCEWSVGDDDTTTNTTVEKNTNTASNFEFETYTNDYWFYSMEIPKGWEEVPVWDEVNIHGIGFRSPLDDALDTFAENLTVTSYISDGETYSQAVASIREGFTTDTTYTKVSDEEITLSGLNTYRVIYTGTDESGNIFRYLHFYIFDETINYQILYTATADTYTQFSDIAEESIMTFTVL